MADNGKDDPVTHCKPAGALRLLTFPPYRKIVEVPGMMAILSERDVTYRQIFTDGRMHPRRSVAVLERLFRRPLGRRHVGS